MCRRVGVSAAFSCLALLGRGSAVSASSSSSGETVDLIQVEVASTRRGSNDTVSTAAITDPSELLLAQLEKHCLKKFAKPLHAVGVDVLGDTKYLDDADLEDVGLKLVQRRKVRATGKASEEEGNSTMASTVSSASLVHKSDDIGVCNDGEVSEETILANLVAELKSIGLANFSQAFVELGVYIAADTAVLSDAELDTIGLVLVQMRRLRETIPYAARLPARDPENQPSLSELGLGNLGAKLVDLGVKNLQDIEYLDDSEMALKGLLLVHRRKMRAADAMAQSRQVKAAEAADGTSEATSSAALLSDKRHARESHDGAARNCRHHSRLHKATERFIGGELSRKELLSVMKDIRGKKVAHERA